ncbi:hypothetical protein OTU49_004376 [Cherax quadricarinatus]|uniref:Endonuclease/exonuclease/phosphatase domain-containing protein n=1 Tax=Cherax quadricarinatus TaxID=27406 RepID=A0AAW0WYJ7_CHEQU
MSLQKVVVTHESETPTVCLSFRYKEDRLKVDRIFNLQRSTQEDLGNILTRISGNIQKIAFKKNKKSSIDIEEIPVKMLRLDNEGIVSEDTTCYDSFVGSYNNHKLLIGDNHYIIDLNPPIIKSMDLPKNMMAGFPVYPNKFETVYAEKEHCVFRWFKSDLKFETEKVAKANLNKIKWIEVNVGVACMTTSEDVGRLLKVVATPFLGERKGENVEVMSTVLVSACPGECPFERRHHFTRTLAGENSLRVISYNILAELYTDSDHARSVLFSSCPPYALDMDYRKQLLTKELLGYNGDLICLQEVDEKVFNRDLYPVLSSQGIEGYYTAKGGQVTEGVAIFCRRNKLRILDRNRFILSNELQNNTLFADMWEKVQASVDLAERMIQRGTVLQHPEKEVSLIFCGDFNSTPECGVYRLMTTQLIDFDDMDWNIKSSELVKGVSLSHNLELDSACGCPPYTNYTTGFYGCLDYIFYQTDKFTIKQVIPMPSHEEVTQHVALPSITFPSDHIPLIADLTFRVR